MLLWGNSDVEALRFAVMVIVNSRQIEVTYGFTH
jgi:hypothetical protein